MKVDVLVSNGPTGHSDVHNIKQVEDQLESNTRVSRLSFLGQYEPAQMGRSLAFRNVQEDHRELQGNVPMILFMPKHGSQGTDETVSTETESSINVLRPGTSSI